MATCPKCTSQFSDDLKKCPNDGETLLPDEACANFDSDLQRGKVVGEYHIEDKIGEGGFGKVYSATHPVIGKRAAIKVLNREYSSNPAVVSRFVSEARSVNQIRHRNIIDIFSFGALDDGRQYLVMELLDGMTLDAYLKKHGRMSPAEALPILRKIARALDAAHAAGIAHRDLKPENVFLCFDDEGQIYPKLLDFGIAKLMGDTSGVSHKTRTGAAMGTPLYMSPEQCRGKSVDHRTDIYAFGVMTHEALTGQLPFDGESMMDLMFKHAKEPPPPMSSMSGKVPPSLDRPVLAMLEKDPALRPPTLTAAIEELSEAARNEGFSVPFKKTTTGGGSEPGASPSHGKMRSFGDAETVAIDEAATGNAPARTLNTVETSVMTGGGGNAKTMLMVAAALVIGIGVTLAVTTGGGEPADTHVQGASSEAPAQPPAEPETTSEAPVPTTLETAEPAPSATATASATAGPVSKIARPPRPPVGTNPKAPPPPKPKTQETPDDLASPFD